jgi:AraC-like DNA-binding protein
MCAVALYFDPRVILGENNALDGVEYLMPFELQAGNGSYRVPANTGIPAQVVSLIHRIHDESLERTTQHSQLAMKTYLKMILVLLLRFYAGDATTTGALDRKNRNLARLQPLLHYIERHFAENISVEDAARLVGMSNSHFMRNFRAVTGQVFTCYLNRYRIARAQQLLVTTDRSIASVSQDVGFCDQSYFGVLFRRFVGTTPREYREACGATSLDTVSRA